MSQQSPIAAVRDSLNVDRSTLRAAVDRVPAALRMRKPAVDRWSVAEVLEHLSIVEGRLVMMLGPLLAAAPANTGAAAGPTEALRTALRNRSNRVSAPDPIQPTGAVNADEAWAALERTRAELLVLLDAAEGRDLTQVSRQHPVLGPLDGYQWLTSIGGHEERHAAQIVEIADALSSRA